jgi:hypothetical protein
VGWGCLAAPAANPSRGEESGLGRGREAEGGEGDEEWRRCSRYHYHLAQQVIGMEGCSVLPLQLPWLLIRRTGDLARQ